MLSVKNTKGLVSSVVLLAGIGISALSFADSKNTKEGLTVDPMIAEKLFEKAKSNDNWKSALVTGKHAQVVFMNVSPLTNPKNEIGMETHAFDQVILIVDGKGKVELNGKISNVNAGDMIFIPEGTAHNVINLDPKKPLKLISFYSETDIPANSIIKKKSDASD